LNQSQVFCWAEVPPTLAWVEVSVSAVGFLLSQSNFQKALTTKAYQ
jgi:hypothetical protein